VRRVNAALASVLGTTPASLAGVGLEDLLHADELPGHRGAWQELKGGRRRVVQLPAQRWRHADGSFRPLRVCGFATSYLADGRPLVRYVVVDGGESARLEEDLRWSSAKVQSFFEQASVGMAELGLDGRFMSANPRLGEILGCTPAELVGRDWHKVSHPEDVHRCESRLAEMAAGRLGRFTVEKRYVRKDGGVVYGVVSIAAIRDAEGRVERFAVVLTEVPGRAGGPEAPAGPGPRRALRVMVVDDEPGVRQTVAAMLAHHGFEVEAASCLAEARACGVDPIDVVLWDAGLLTSPDAVGEVEAAFPGSAVVVMSGNPSLLHGPDALRKPFSVEELAACVLRAAGVRSAPAP
jgi:PAS domain S-box-containing protein